MISFVSQVLLSVDSVNSYIAWDFSLVQGKINMVLQCCYTFFSECHDIYLGCSELPFVYCQDIGFSLEFESPNGEKIVSSNVICVLSSVSYSHLASSKAFLMLFFISHLCLQSLSPQPAFSFSGVFCSLCPCFYFNFSFHGC